jgi:hypothetical protein
MLQRSRPVCLKTVRLIDTDLAKLTPAQVTMRTPFVLDRVASHLKLPPVSREGADFLGWTRLCIGLKSTSAQRRQGLWRHQEDWVWTGAHLDKALQAMGLQKSLGWLVAVAVVWVPVQQYEKNKELRSIAPDKPQVPGMPWRRVGPATLPALNGLQWLAPYYALEDSRFLLEAYEPQLHVQQYVRISGGRSAGGRGWKQAVL